MSDDNKNVKGLSEEMAISVVKEFVGNNMYVLLSTVKANMIKGFSFPYVGELEGVGKALYFFSTYEYAKEFVEENDFEILDGIYPLAKLEPGEKMNSFETICAIAAHLGIMYIDFNPGHPNIALGTTIPWLQKIFNYDLSKITLIVSNKVKEEMEKKEDSKIPIDFNPMPIFKFKDPYFIEKERKDELDVIPLKEYEDVKLYFDAIKDLSISELCYLSEVIKKTYLPRASAEGNKERMDILMAMYSVLDGIVIQKLNMIKTYTLLDNDEMFINHNQAAYLIYTDRFQYMGEYRYKEISLDGFLRQMEVNDVSYAIITSGPGHMHLTSAAAIRQTLDKLTKRQY